MIGEAPGAEEDRQGEPFVGRAGQLLNAMLLAIGLPRETVFIANILKCRPPGNRDPEACRSVALPAVPVEPDRAAQAQNHAGRRAHRRAEPAGHRRAAGAAARQAAHFGEANTPLVITYHPAYLLRTPSDKRKAWEDLKFARATYRASSVGAEPDGRGARRPARGAGGPHPADDGDRPAGGRRPSSRRVTRFRGARTSFATACAWATPAARSTWPARSSATAS